MEANCAAVQLSVGVRAPKAATRRARRRIGFCSSAATDCTCVASDPPYLTASNENGYHLVMQSSRQHKSTLNQKLEPAGSSQRERVMSKQLLEIGRASCRERV